jgi:2-phospho-L-lactate guanylyltransferase
MQHALSPDQGATRAAVILPVKAFAHGKLRLAPTLDPTTRAALARAMATVVRRAAAPLPVVVVCDDDEVRSWAEDAGATSLWTPSLGLNGAVEAGVRHLAAIGVPRAIVAHADLPLATDLTWLADGDGIAIVPDRHGDGSNVVSLPSAIGFRFAYGPGSCARHRVEAARLGVEARLVLDDALGWDVDLVADLDVPDPYQLPREVAEVLDAAALAPSEHP